MRGPVLIGLCTLLLSACAGEPRTATIEAAGRPLAVVEGAPSHGAPLVVVIEGDGRAHDRAGRPTRDPTPLHPQGLAIARALPGAAWLARPCQFTRARDPACQPRDWTVDRFSAEALKTMDAGVDTLKARAEAASVVLVGWSGGGTLAAALARKRSDVVGLITMAAPLDVEAWTRANGLSLLNLAPEVAELPKSRLPIPQVHLFGARDRVVPPDPAMPAAKTLAGTTGVVAVKPQDHACCWAEEAAEAAARLAAINPS